MTEINWKKQQPNHLIARDLTDIYRLSDSSFMEPYRAKSDKWWPRIHQVDTNINLDEW